MLNTNSSANIDGKLKELPLEARHSICLELARKRRQSVASSIFIPKEISEKLRVQKSTQTGDRATTPPNSTPHKTTTLAPCRKLGNKLERKMKHKYHKLARGLNIPKHALPSTPTTPLKHPESFPIVRQTVTSRQVRCVVESLRDGKDAEVPTKNSNKTDDESEQPPADRLPHMPALEETKQRNSTSPARSVEELQSPPAVGNGSYSATLATEPYVITVDLSGVQLDEYAKDDLKHSQPCTEANVRSNSSDQCTKARHGHCEMVECAQLATDASCCAEKSYRNDLELLEDVCNRAHPDTTNYAAYQKECAPQHLPDAATETRTNEQVIDLSSRSLYKMPASSPASRHNTSPPNYVLSPAVPEEIAKNPLKNDAIPLPARFSHSSTAMHSPQQYTPAKAPKNLPSHWSGYAGPQTPQRELPYLSIPAQSLSPYQRTVPVPFETPPISPQEPQWPPPRHFNAHDFEHVAWYNAKMAAHQVSLPYGAQHMPPNAYAPAMDPSTSTAVPHIWPYADPAPYALHSKSRLKKSHKTPPYMGANATVAPTLPPAYNPQLSMPPNVYATPPHAYSRPLNAAPASPAIYAEHYAGLPCCRNIFPPPPPPVPYHYATAAYHPYALAHQLSPSSPKTSTAPHKGNGRRLRSPNWYRSAAININGYLVDVLHPALRPV